MGRDDDAADVASTVIRAVPPPESCLSPEDIVRFIGSAGTPSELRRFERHVDRCEDCRRSVAGTVRSNRKSAKQLDEADAPTIVQSEPAPLPVPPTIRAIVPRRAASSPVSDLSEGTTIGRYQLVSRLGAGAMGVVWLAHDPQLDRKIAIKVVHPSVARSPDAKDRLRREARALAKLSHRAVVTVHDAGEVDGRLFLAMEFVEGTTLGHMLRTRAGESLADWRHWANMLLDAGRGLASAHRAGILHRDFKPDNVLVDETGRVCVADFGLAALGDETRAALSHRWSTPDLDLTMTGALLGTPAYMCPQQLRGETIDARADQFSFCVATWEALYGTRPFVVASLGLDAIPELASAIETGALPEPPPGNETPEAVRAALARGLAADPQARWPSMDALLAALERAMRPERRATEVSARTVSGFVVACAATLAIAVMVVAMLTGRDEALHARALFAAPTVATIAVSPDGKWIALGSDRLEVRSLTGGSEVWSVPLDGPADVVALEFEGAALRIALHNSNTIHRWDYRNDNKTIAVEVADIGARWYGRTALGELTYDLAERTLVVVAQGKPVRTRKAVKDAEVFAISPDRRRLAYVDTDRFFGNIVVWDLERDTAMQSHALHSVTALAWYDDTSLVFASGIVDRPSIYRAAVGDQIGRPRKLYDRPTGWFSMLRVHEHRIYAIDLQPTPHTTMIEASGRERDLDPTSGAAPIGWLASGEFLTWNRSTHRIHRRAPGGVNDITAAVLDGEPANATLAGDVVIAALRGSKGRRVVAVTLAGHRSWQHDDLETLAVRCAGDRAPPCFAVRTTGGRHAIVAVDPLTGALAPMPIHDTDDTIEDIAVSADGERILLGKRSHEVPELDARGALVATHPTDLPSVRSVAFDPQSGFLVAGARSRNHYEVMRVAGGKSRVLSVTESALLSLVRPSGTGDVLVLARTYAPEVFELVR